MHRGCPGTDGDQQDVGPGHELLGPLRVRRVDDQHLGTDVRQHHGGLVVGVGRVQRHEGDAEAAEAEVEPDALERRLRPPGHALASARPQRMQRVGEPVGEDVDLAEGQPIVAQCHSQARRCRPGGTGQHVIGYERHCSPFKNGMKSRRPVSRRESMPRVSGRRTSHRALGYRAPDADRPTASSTARDPEGEHGETGGQSRHHHRSR